MERVEALDTLLREDRVIFGRGYSPIELRAALNQAEWPGFINHAALSELLIRVLDLAKAGLADRGRDEARFLEPLYQRAETLVSPAAAMKNALEGGVSMEDVSAAYAAL